MKKAIEAQLINGVDTPLQTNGRGIHTFGFDPKKTSTLKLEILQFIEAGGDQRIKRYEKALKVVANLEPQKQVQLKKSSNVVAAELLKRIR